jgi:hypothetical protein
MPQRIINTGGMTGPTSASLQTTITNKLNLIQSGSIIYATDINDIISTYNSFLTHFHQISDLYGIFNFGDGLGSPYSGSGNFEADSSSAATYPSSSITTISTNDTILVSKHNQMASAINGIQGHNHTWDDRTS